MHGLGNDFIIIKNLAEEDLGDLPALAKQICHRNFGVGADGLILVLPSDKADVRMRIFNSDGSEPEMCGNGIRCFAIYVYQEGIVTKEIIKVETLAGIIVPRLIMEDKKISGVEVDMGPPVLDPDQIPIRGFAAGPVVEEPLEVNGKKLSITAVSMGNPHCVIFVPEISQIPFEIWGPKLETHPAFPRKTNVEFVQVIDQEQVQVRVWERGAGPTLACGTGACAVAVAGVLSGRTGRRVTVSLPGGDLQVLWNEKDNRVYMTGPAVEVFRGELPL
jgi:diaminopimelate epimerase